MRLWAAIIGQEKYGLSANEMLAKYTIEELMEMMAASRIQADWLQEANKKPPHS